MRNVFSIARGQRAQEQNVCSAARSALILFAAAVLALAAPALAEHTRWWRQSTFEDFDKGTAKGVALRSDGKMFLAPRFAEFSDANLAYLLQIRADSKGNLYAAGGSNAKVLRIDAERQIDQRVRILRTRRPGHRAGRRGKSVRGNVARRKNVQGNARRPILRLLRSKNEIHLGPGRGQGRNSVRGDRRHGQNFLRRAGRQRTGFLFQRRNSYSFAGARCERKCFGRDRAERARSAHPKGRKQSPRICPLRNLQEGNHIAAAGTERRSVRSRGRRKNSAAPGQSRPITTDTTTTTNFVISLGPSGTATGATQQTQPNPFTPLPTVNSSSVYRIAADGSPEELWSTRDEVVYSMGLLPGGKLLLGTGNDGAVLELEGNHVFSKLAKATSRQVTAIAPGPGGKLFLAAANPGKVFTLGPENESEGTYESQPFDAHIFSRWGRTMWLGENIASATARRARASRSTRARAILPILIPIGATGQDRTQIHPAINWNALPRGLCNGRPFCAEAAANSAARARH